MATTTNYSWTTPDDTALVKDGAAAIRTLGSSADTTVKALNPGTTAGDIDYYTTSTAKARVAIGTAGQVLQVNSGATAPEWVTLVSGGMTLLSTTTLSGASTTISSISGSYKTLYGVVFAYTNSGSNDMFVMNPNNSSACTFSTFCGSSAAGVTVDQQTDAIALCHRSNPLQVLGSNSDNAVFFQIENYASTTSFKPITTGGRYVGRLSDVVGFGGSGGFNSTSAITSLVFSNTGGGSYTAGTVLLYGVN
jgi:hypothetical protein